MAGFSRAMNCSVQVAAASEADVNAHGIPKGAQQCPITVIYEQAADTRETHRGRGARGVTRRETQQTRMKQAESPSKLESQTQGKQKAQLMFRMWSNVQNS